jgi:hypothetical protein
VTTINIYRQTVSVGLIDARLGMAVLSLAEALVGQTQVAQGNPASASLCDQYIGDTALPKTNAQVPLPSRD